MDMATSIYQLKSNVINNEFRGFIGGLNNAELIIPQFKSANDFLKGEKLINALLLSHAKIKHGRFGIPRQRLWGNTELFRDAEELRYGNLQG